MSFHLITGLMGGGKSYYGVELCLRAAKEGATVHTNLPLVQKEWEALGLWDRIVKLPRDPNKWIRFEKGTVDGQEEEVPCSDCIVGGSEGRENLVVFDEASIVFRVKDQQKNKDKHQPVFDLVALSRHVGLEIYFIAQHEENVSADLRKLAEFRTKCIKTDKITGIGFLLAPLFGDFRRILYRGLSKTPDMKTWHRFANSNGKLYKTHGMAESVFMRIDATRKSKAMDAGKKKGVFLFLLLPVIIVLCIGFAAWKFKRDTIDPRMAKADGKAVSGASPAPSGSPVAKVKAQPKKGGWRVLEWDAQDELVLGVKMSTPQGVKIYTRTGETLAVGLSYMGEPINEYTPWGDWHYFRTLFGRLIVVRPLQWAERQELPPVTITGKPPQQDDETKIPDVMDPINRAIGNMTDKIRGT